MTGSSVVHPSRVVKLANAASVFTAFVFAGEAIPTPLVTGEPDLLSRCAYVQMHVSLVRDLAS